jgi:hypothetical protein
MVHAVLARLMAGVTLLLSVPWLAAQDTRAAARINAYLVRLEGYGYSGVVMVARGDSIIVHSAYGLADQKRKIPMRTDHKMGFGGDYARVTRDEIVRRC